MNVENQWHGAICKVSLLASHWATHTLPITIMGVCLWNTPLQGQNSAIFENECTYENDKTQPFLRINTPKRTKLCFVFGNAYTSKRAKCWHFWKLFVDVLDKICRTCYHTDPRFGTKPYYGVHASTHPQVHIHQNHRDYPLEISQLMNVENNGLVPSANFPFLHLIGPHTHYQSLSWVPVSDIYLCKDKSQPFLKMNTPLK